MDEYIRMWKNFFNFYDRTRRRGYWMAYLFNLIFAFLITIISYVTQNNFFITIYLLAVFTPYMAILVRRIRDAGKPWQWVFISIVPLIGPICMFIIACMPSAPDDGTPDV